jgi:DNA-binding transcriptional LysR family regulator
MQPEKLDLKKLKAFELVAKEGSLRTAAQRLNLTTSAVSFCIRRLESDLGVELFKRLPNRLALTLAGQHLLLEAESILTSVERAVSAMPRGDSPHEVSISVCNSGLISFIAPRLSDFMHQFPNTRLSLLMHTSSEAMALVDAGRLDICLGRFQSQVVPSDLECKVVFESDFSIACKRKHPIVRRGVCLSNLSEYPLITLHRHTQMRAVVEKVFQQNRLKTPQFIEVRNCHAALETAAHEEAIAVVHSVCTKTSPDSKLSYLNAKNLFPKATFQAIFRKNANAAAITPVLKALVGQPIN